MEPQELIHKLAERGITLKLEGLHLRWESEKPIPTAIATTIATYRPALRRYLKAQQAPEQAGELDLGEQQDHPGDNPPEVQKEDDLDHPGPSSPTVLFPAEPFAPVPLSGDPLGALPAETKDSMTAYLLRAIRHLQALEPRPDLLTLRAAAVEAFAFTWPPEKQLAQRDKYLSKLAHLDKPPAEASKPELWIDLLALHGWAKSRESMGANNPGNAAWIQAAERALGAWRKS